MSFDLKSRYEIRDRAGNKSELSGVSDRPMQCCHLNHSRELGEYSTPEMGVLTTDIEHCAYHLIFRPNPWDIGMTRKDNEVAIHSLYCQIDKFNKKQGIVMSGQELFNLIEQAKDYWFYYLGIES